MSSISIDLTPQQIELTISGLNVQAKNLSALIETFKNKGTNPVVDQFIEELQDIRKLSAKLGTYL